MTRPPILRQAALAALADSAGLLTTVQVQIALGTSLRSAGRVLRESEQAGLVSQAGTIPGRGPGRPVAVWRITGNGRRELTRIQQATADQTAAQERAVWQAAAKAAAMEYAKMVYTPAEGRRRRRDLTMLLYVNGHTEQEIADVFGITRQMVSLDLAPLRADGSRERAEAMRRSWHGAVR